MRAANSAEDSPSQMTSYPQISTYLLTLNSRFPSYKRSSFSFSLLLSQFRPTFRSHTYNTSLNDDAPTASKAESTSPQQQPTYLSSAASAVSAASLLLRSRLMWSVSDRGCLLAWRAWLHTYNSVSQAGSSFEAIQF